MKSLLLGTLCACLTTLFSVSAQAVPVSGQGTWETTLQARDLDGNTATIEAYYDTELDITWLADANYAQTSGWDPNGDGKLKRGEHQSFVRDLNNSTLLGFNDWRLPMMLDIGGDGCNYSNDGTDCGYNVETSDSSDVYSEYASLFDDTLGNVGRFDTAGNEFQPGWGLSNTGPFSNVQSSIYWTDTAYAPNPFNEGWFFALGSGGQDVMPNSQTWFSWVVRNGDSGTAVGAVVPVPAALWLFASGLLGMIGIARRKAA
jgi:hypothetical protein